MTWTTEQLQALSQDEFAAVLDGLNESYHNFRSEDGQITKTHLLSDRTYDWCLGMYEARFGKYTKVGAPAISSKRPWQRKYEAPVYLGSLDKITKPEQLQLWMAKHPGPYVQSSKVDGCSLLYEFPKTPNGPCMLSTRGDEGVGVDMTHLLPFLHLPREDTSGASVIAVRGELIIFNSDFEKLQQEWRAAGCDVLPDVRSTVTSLCISQTIDLRAAKYAKFVAYQAFTHSYERLVKQSTQFELLRQVGFLLPWVRTSATCDFEELTAITCAFRAKQEDVDGEEDEDDATTTLRTTPAGATEGPLDYATDGLVIMQDMEVDVPERGTDPPYGRALKVQAECKETTVVRLEWTVRNNFIKPKVHVEPVLIGARWLKRASGKNAAWMVDNKMTVGSRVLVSFANEIIPDILENLKPANEACKESDILPVHLDFEWNASHKDIRLKNHADSDSAKKQRLERFFKHLKSDGLGPANCLLMYERWKGDWHAILTAKPQDYVNAKGTNKKSAQLMCEAVKACIADVPLPRLMDASGCFGLGLGETKLKSVVAVYPDIMQWRIIDEEEDEDEDVDALPPPPVDVAATVVLTMSEAIERIQQVKLFQKLASQFCAQLGVFQEFCARFPMITHVIPQISDAKAKSSRKRKEQEQGEDEKEEEEDDVSASAKRAKLPEPTPMMAMPSHIICTGFTFSAAIEQQLEERGVDTTGSVSKKTKMLVVKEHGTGTSKETKARALGIPILTRAEFVARFALNDL